MLAIPLNLDCLVLTPVLGYINPFLIGMLVMRKIGLGWLLYGVMDPSKIVLRHCSWGLALPAFRPTVSAGQCPTPFLPRPPA